MVVTDHLVKSLHCKHDCQSFLPNLPVVAPCMRQRWHWMRNSPFCSMGDHMWGNIANPINGGIFCKSVMHTAFQILEELARNSNLLPIFLRGLLGSMGLQCGCQMRVVHARFACTQFITSPDCLFVLPVESFGWWYSTPTGPNSTDAQWSYG